MQVGMALTPNSLARRKQGIQLLTFTTDDQRSAVIFVPWPRPDGRIAAARLRRRCLAPSGGVVRPRRVVRFARLIQRHGRAFWRTCGPRRLRRQSQPALIATQGDAAANPAPQRRQADQSSRVSCTMAVPGLSPPWAAKRPACADGPLRVMLAHLGTSSVASRGPAGRRWIDAAGEEEATRRRHRR
jgi:hypothetical protein